ncbi:LLM class flavin-dependent oxidoreductase [Acidiferrobacter sp.]|uniref:LLM class flavin-dependent oxidoreductase n=1 Tax=Acidiferrobacter sp. TaxID=1872107 RepID=UPI00260B15AD|nr:LLM class flavin-dependent oxidoreductase [Acidiferrobacter sp.]
MEFDLFYELAVPDFAGRHERQVFEETLEEIAFADGLGFGTAWLTEHHFMPQYGHSSAPDLFLAAAAQKTRRIRLGLGIVPLPYHHPLHVAERAATLDILSGGRLELGVGRGFSPKEYETFGIRTEDSRGLVDEGLEILIKAFAEPGPIDFAGRHFRFADIAVRPRPIQQPHPPLWMAAVSPESFELAARLGLGVLAGPFKPWFMVKEDIRHYRAAYARHHGDNPRCPPRVGMTLGIFCLDDGKEARAIARTNITWFYRELLRLTAPLLSRLQDGYEYYRRFGALAPLLKGGVNLPILERLGMVVAGDPEHCRKRLRTYAEAGVDHLLCAVVAGASPTDQNRQALTLLSEQVLPAFSACAS